MTRQIPIEPLPIWVQESADQKPEVKALPEWIYVVGENDDPEH